MPPNSKSQGVNSFAEHFDDSFFESVPEQAGVYLVLDSSEGVIFIGKSKNLKKRIKSYKYVDPVRASNNAWNIVSEAADIQWETFRNVKKATLRANYLIRRYRPRYNSYSSSSESYRFIGFKLINNQVHFMTGNDIRIFDDHLVYGSFKHFGQFIRGYSSLLRLFWAINQEPNQIERIPLLLLKRQPPETYSIAFNSSWKQKEMDRWVYLLKRYLKGTALALVKEMKKNLNDTFDSSDSFLERLFKNDFREMTLFYEKGPKINFSLYQRYHLKSPLIAPDELDDLSDSVNP